MSEDLVKFEINGVEVEAKPGSMLIEVADANGIQIPRFCYHKKLSIAANCRMCMVEVEKAPKPLPACATPVAAGMKVHTQSPVAIAAQKGTMEFLLINHPLDCPVCDQGGECELQDVAVAYGDDVSRYSEAKRVIRDKDIGPLIATDMTRCIHCTRCVRFGEEIAGLREMGATGRGEFVEIGTYIEKTIDSEMSGNIIDLCPVGALTSKPSRFYGRAWELTQHSSIAAHDCVGSAVSIHSLQGKAVRVVPRDHEAVNETWLSDRDRFAYQGLEAADRLLSPMIKYHDQWREATWEEALQVVNDKLRSFKPENVAALFSPNTTTEELYLGQKYCRGLGVNAIDHRLRQSDFSDQENAPLFPWLGTDIASLENQDAVLLVGSNIRKDQPILAHRLRKASMKGASIMSLDCVDYDFTFPLAQQILTDPTALVTSLAAVCGQLLQHSGADVPAQLQSIVSSAKADDAHQSIAKTLLEAESSLIILGNLAVSHPASSLLRALASTITASSKISFGILSEGANAAGACLAGVLPHRAVAGQPVEQNGEDAISMLSHPKQAYLLWGIEPEYDCYDPAQALNAVSTANFVVAATAFASDSMKNYANVLLPVGAAGEISGTYVNVEGRWQSFRAASTLPGETRPGWKVLRVLGNLADLDGFDYVSVDQLRDELKQAFDTELTFSNQIELSSSYQMPAAAGQFELMRVSSINSYRSDALVRRASALQQTTDGQFDGMMMNRMDAKVLGLNNENRIDVGEDGRGVSLPIIVSDAIARGCVFIPAGTEGSSGLAGCFGAIEVKKP